MIRKLKKLNWSYALGEIALIFIGITLAIMFQNWNDARKQEALEHAALVELQVALENDWNDINSNIRTHQRGVASCQNLLKLLDEPGPVNGDMVMGELVQIVDFTFLVSDISTYEYLKSVGLQLIKNDTLRRQIPKLYDVVYEGIYGVEKNTDFLQKKIFDNMQKYYTPGGQFFKLIKENNGMKQDNQLKFDIKIMERSHALMQSRYEKKVKPELEKLMVMVEEELKK